jgi:hypothetical protein
MKRNNSVATFMNTAIEKLLDWCSLQGLLRGLQQSLTYPFEKLVETVVLL